MACQETPEAFSRIPENRMVVDLGTKWDSVRLSWWHDLFHSFKTLCTAALEVLDELGCAGSYSTRALPFRNVQFSRFRILLADFH